MSFASEVKSELCRLSVPEDHCRLAELAGVFDFCGSLEFSAAHVACNIQTRNAQVARRCYRMIKEELGLQAQLFVRRGERLHRAEYNYLVQTLGEEQVELLLLRLDKGNIRDALLPQSCLPVLQRECCRQAYLRGVFLAAGSLNDPQTAAYHLEIVSEAEIHAEDIVQLLGGFNLQAKITTRKSNYIVYIKNRSAIADFLTRVGAVQQRLIYEDVLLQKDMSNIANRERNLDQANANRQGYTGRRQESAIHWLQQRRLMSRLSKAQQQAARIRLDDPEASLQELAEELGITKSAINHRLRSICISAENSGWTYSEDC